MGANHHVGLTAAQVANGFLLLLGRTEAVEQLDGHRHALHPTQYGLIMLPSQDRGRHQEGALFALADTFKSGAQGHLGLTETDVSAQQAVHRNRPLHIVFNLIDAPKLIIGLFKLKPALKVILQIGVGGEGITRCMHPLGIKGDKALG